MSRLCLSRARPQLVASSYPRPRFHPTVTRAGVCHQRTKRCAKANKMDFTFDGRFAAAFAPGAAKLAPPATSEAALCACACAWFVDTASTAPSRYRPDQRAGWHTAKHEYEMRIRIKPGRPGLQACRSRLSYFPRRERRYHLVTREGKTWYVVAPKSVEVSYPSRPGH